MPRGRTPLVFVVAALASCSVLNNLDEYSSGGHDASTNDSATDTASDVADTRTDGTDLGIDSAIDSQIDSGTDTNDTAPVVDAVDSAGETVVDSGVDTTDTADTATIDASDTADVADASDAAEAGSCGSVCGFGLSEIMVRVISGTGDKHEWLELTNYTSGTLDVSGVTVKVFTTSEKASFTFGTGTTLVAGEAVVIVDDDVTFKADLITGYVLGKVFSFAKSDVLTNTTTFDVRIYASGVTAPYEDAVVPTRSWPLARAYAYPPPSSTCPSTGRLTGTGTLSAPWKDVPIDVSQKYGEFPAGTTPLYGSPTKPNTGVACP